jgi:predicted enzyme related to lactoylglutathione lyase
MILVKFNDRRFNEDSGHCQRHKPSINFFQKPTIFSTIITTIQMLAVSVNENPHKIKIVTTMKKIILIVPAFAMTFALGFAFNSITTKNSNRQRSLKKVTGIGGIFFKCKDPKKMREWYETNLGLNTNQYGAVFEWRQGADSTKKGFTQWSPFNEKTKYFEPSTKDFMINYRVENMEALVAELKKNAVTVVDTIETAGYGKFVHILDMEGNKIELWEPNDIEYEKLGKQLGSKTTK